MLGSIAGRSSDAARARAAGFRTALLRLPRRRGCWRAHRRRAQLLRFSDAVDCVINEAAPEKGGRDPRRPADIATKGKFDDSEFEVLLYEFKADLNAYLAGLGSRAPSRSLADLIAFNERNREREMPYVGQEIFVMAQKKGPLTTRAYRLALAKNHRVSRNEGIDAVMAKHRLDAIVAPTGGPAWPTDLLNGDHFTGGSSTMAAVAGYPSVTVPAGFVHGLPVGISFFASAYSEPTLIKVAYALEQTFKARTAPLLRRWTSGADADHAEGPCALRRDRRARRVGPRRRRLGAGQADGPTTTATSSSGRAGGDASEAAAVLDLSGGRAA